VFAESFLILFIIFSGRIYKIKQVFQEIKIKYVFVVAFILGLWWWLYIYGIMTDRILEVAFGYFLSPVMSMAVSRFIFKEEITKIQKLAIMVAVLGVLLMAIYLLNMQTFPWIAITIGFCYSFYGIFKKQVPGDSLIIQAMEILVLLPFALSFIIYSYYIGEMHIFMQNIKIDLLLISTGIITVLPLLWYSQAAKNLTVIILSFIQFIPPTCNFLLAYFVYKEPVSMMKFFAFCLIWLSLIIFIGNSILIKRNRL
jgi:chloramphenicol-sensitive protein RarD